MNNELQRRLSEVLERPHRLGMIGGTIEEQLAHCASFSRVLGQARHERGLMAGCAVDLGSGGGVPGIPLAAAHAELSWTLVEIRTARATELERTALRAGLDLGVETRAAQELGQDERHREQASVVVARAFGPPALTAECASGLLATGGILVVSEPPDTPSEQRWPHEELARLGLGLATVAVDAGHHFVVIEKSGILAANVPRLPARGDRGWF